jgi:hypothetical protein
MLQLKEVDDDMMTDEGRHFDIASLSPLLSRLRK